MSKRGDELLFDSLVNRWSKDSAPAAGSTAQAVSPAVTGPRELHHIDDVGYSLVNLTAATVQSTLKIRSGPTSGSTVLGTISVSVPAGGSTQFNGPFTFLGKPGTQVSAEWSSIAASVVQTVTLCGWKEMTR